MPSRSIGVAFSSGSRLSPVTGADLVWESREVHGTDADAIEPIHPNSVRPCVMVRRNLAGSTGDVRQHRGAVVTVAAMELGTSSLGPRAHRRTEAGGGRPGLPVAELPGAVS